MSLSPDIFTVRTGQVTVIIAPLRVLSPLRAAASDHAAFDSAPTTVRHLELALDACRDIHALRQFCRRCGLQTHSLSYVDGAALRAWLVNAVILGQLGVMLLPEVLSTAGTVRALAIETKARVAARIDKVTLAEGAGTLWRDPVKLIEALQKDGPGPQSATAAGGGAGRHQAGGLTPAEVQRMAIEDRILEVLRRVLASPELPAWIRQDMKALVDPKPLSGTVAVLTAWAASRAGQTGQLADLALLVLGQAAVDNQLLSGLKNLSQALDRTREARDSDDLQQAAQRLARAITHIGPADLNRLLAYSSSLPIGVPLKPSAKRAPPPKRPPAERFATRPARPAPPTPSTGPEFPAPSKQAQALRRAAAKGSAGCKICKA